MALDAEAYLEQLQALLPPGPAWPRDPDCDLTRTLQGLAEEFVRIDGRAEDLLREMNPRTAVELLPEWEEEYGITPPAGATLDHRQQAVAFKYAEEGDIKKPYFVAKAAAMGYTIRIDDQLDDGSWIEFSAGVNDAGETLATANVRLPWVWQVHVQAVPAQIPTPTLEEMLEDLKPAHYELEFFYP